jgi:hypothetical protein
LQLYTSSYARSSLSRTSTQNIHMMLRLYEMFITKETLHTAPSREGKQKRDTRLSQFTSLQLRLSEHWQSILGCDAHAQLNGRIFKHNYQTFTHAIWQSKPWYHHPSRLILPDYYAHRSSASPSHSLQELASDLFYFQLFQVPICSLWICPRCCRLAFGSRASRKRSSSGKR